MPPEFLAISVLRRRELDAQAEVFPTRAESNEDSERWQKWIAEEAEKLPPEKRAAFVQNEMCTINGDFDVHPDETLKDFIAKIQRPPSTPVETDYFHWRSTVNLQISREEKDERFIAMKRKLDTLIPPQQPCTILQSFKVITIDGNEIKLAGNLKKRIFLIYLFRWKKMNPTGIFYSENILEDLNKLLPKHRRIKTDSLKYGLFRDKSKEFGLLFETLDIGTEKYRLIPDAPSALDLDAAFEKAISA